MSLCESPRVRHLSFTGGTGVYHFYRQPMRQRSIRDALVTVFAVNAVLRLVLMGVAGHLGTHSLWLAMEAVPVLLLQAHWMSRRPPRWSGSTLRRAAAGLLMIVAVGLIATALHALNQGLLTLREGSRQARGGNTRTSVRPRTDPPVGGAYGLHGVAGPPGLRLHTGNRCPARLGRGLRAPAECL